MPLYGIPGPGGFRSRLAAQRWHVPFVTSSVLHRRCVHLSPRAHYSYWENLYALFGNFAPLRNIALALFGNALNFCVFWMWNLLAVLDIHADNIDLQITPTSALVSFFFSCVFEDIHNCSERPWTFLETDWNMIMLPTEMIAECYNLHKVWKYSYSKNEH